MCHVVRVLSLVFVSFAIFSRVVSHVVSCRVMPCRVVSCRAVPRRVVSCFVVSRVVLSRRSHTRGGRRGEGGKRKLKGGKGRMFHGKSELLQRSNET